MKKIYIALAVVATALLSSCEKEKDFKDLTPVGENGIAFTLGDVATRSMDVVSDTPVQKGFSIPVGVDAQGDALFLEETIENLNPGPVTRGAPAYTVNVGTLYSTMGVYASGNFGDATFEVMDYYDRKEASQGKGWRYHHNYNASPWPADKDDKVDFYLRMPASDMEIDYSTAGSIAFDFTSTASGSAQKDMLFGHTAISKNEHDGFLPNGAPVDMVHAFSGVKFRSGSENGGQTKTIIAKVEFSGLKGAGHCVITYDNNNNASIVWSNLGAGPEKFTLGFDNPDYSQEAWVDGTVTYEKGENPSFGDSWYSAAADRNLNNENGELTFWFIPQEITDDVKLKVTFCVKTPDTATASGGGFEEYEIDFGELVNKGRETPVKWEAGQLRTYTLNPKLVDVEIFDTMAGYKKSNLHVTNTGNVSELVRILVIGNWYGWASQADADAGKEPMILVGYTTDGSTGDNTMIDPWFREDDHWGSYFDTSFKGGRPASNSKWVRGTGSYFYYMDAIGPNSKLSGTDALFQDYTLPADEVPTIYIPNSSSNIRSEAVGVHLVMEVVIQAIAAPSVRADGTPYPAGQVMPAADIWKAWSDAIGKEITEKPYTN